MDPVDIIIACAIEKKYYDIEAKPQKEASSFRFPGSDAACRCFQSQQLPIEHARFAATHLAGTKASKDKVEQVAKHLAKASNNCCIDSEINTKVIEDIRKERLFNRLTACSSTKR